MTTIVVDGQRLGFGGLSRSYPFLNLARILRRPYDRVLAAAEMIDRWPLRQFGVDYVSATVEEAEQKHCLRVANAVGGLTTDEVGVVWRVCSAPWRWQFPPEGRGL